jgi:hypothetical protein
LIERSAAGIGSRKLVEACVFYVNPCETLHCLCSYCLNTYPFITVSVCSNKLANENSFAIGPPDAGRPITLQERSMARRRQTLRAEQAKVIDGGKNEARWLKPQRGKFKSNIVNCKSPSDR